MSHTMNTRAAISENAIIGENVEFGRYCIVEEGAVIGDNTHIGPFCIVRKNARVGSNCSFTAYCEIREGCVVGDNTTMGSRCTLSAGVKIGKNVTIKYGFVATDTPDLTSGEKEVGTIGDGSMFGVDVVLMPGVDIGEKCIIGACSQVRHDVPDHEVWYGNPAEFYRKRDIGE